MKPLQAIRFCEVFGRNWHIDRKMFKVTCLSAEETFISSKHNGMIFFTQKCSNKDTLFSRGKSSMAAPHSCVSRVCTWGCRDLCAWLGVTGAPEESIRTSSLHVVPGGRDFRFTEKG